MAYTPIFPELFYEIIIINVLRVYIVSTITKKIPFTAIYLL